MATVEGAAAADVRYCKRKDRSVEVQRWQYFLKKTPGMPPKLRLNGVFDAATEQATKAFQKPPASSGQASKAASPMSLLRGSSTWTELSPSGLACKPPAARSLFDRLNDWGSLALEAPRVMAETGQLDVETAEVAVSRGYPMPTATYYASRKSSVYPAAPTTLASPTHAWRTATFGSFEYERAPTDTDAEAIAFCDDWAKKNIIRVPIPQLSHVGHKSMQFHKDAADRLVKLFQSWEKANLLHLILSYSGSFAARYQRGAAPKEGKPEDPTKLSNHSWGTAFDINKAWNELHQVPAILPATGAVRELAALAASCGFYWGGHYGKRPDGMHFEIGTPA